MQNETVQLAHIIKSRHFNNDINELHLNTSYIYMSRIHVFSNQGNHIIKSWPLSFVYQINQFHLMRGDFIN